VRADAFREEGDAADRVRAALDAVPGITAVAHNPRTGSLLVEYQPGHAEPETLLARIASAAGLAMPDEGARLRPREPVLVAIDAARELNDLVHEATGHTADLRALVPAGMAALAAYSFAFSKEDRLPRWDNLLYWSYNIFRELHRREIEASGALRAHGHAGGQPPTPGPRTDPQKP
jgi:Heavy metal associated domain 2